VVAHLSPLHREHRAVVTVSNDVGAGDVVCAYALACVSEGDRSRTNG
jgi:hypothetical protein